MSISQKQRIKQHLQKGKTITQMQALRKWRCFRLSARINEIRNDGIDVRTTMVDNSHNSGAHAKYKIVDDE